MYMDILEKDKNLFLSTYNRLPLNIDFGQGVHLFDKEGNRYLDFFSGLAVNALGYAHPRIVQAVADQISKFAHLSNNYITDIQIEFTELLLKYAKMSKAFLTNSGTESIEGAIKLIRKKFGPDKKIFALTDSFHGRTYGALSLTGRQKYKTGFEPLLPNISYINFNDVADLEKKIDNDTAAIFLELIQGEGGINLVSQDLITKIIELKKRYSFLIVADEIQSGIGRTGRPFAYNHFNLSPDIVVVAKAIGGGLPLGAFLVSPEISDVFEIGKHGTTFGGNPVSCAAGKVVLEVVFESGLMNEVAELGDYFFNQLLEIKKMFPGDIKDVRGKGFMIGIELSYECSDIVKEMREKKVLVNCTNKNVIRILPPLISTKSDIDFFLFNLHETLKTKNNK